MMRRAIKHLILLTTAIAIWAPAPASADALFSPWAGIILGNEGAERGRVFGLTAGGMHEGVVGGEVDFGFSPNFFGEAFDNSALTVMGNIIVGIPIGGSTGVGLRPYVAGGGGLIRTQIDTPSGRDDASNDFGFNFGGGLMGFFSDHFGVRGDLRYFRNLKGSGSDGPGPLGLDLEKFDVWRASIGIVIR